MVHARVGLIVLQALESHAIADSTRLPISHPDHSLGAGLGPMSETDDEDADSAHATDTDVEGGLPWKPKFNKVFLYSSSPGNICTLEVSRRSAMLTAERRDSGA